MAEDIRNTDTSERVNSEQINRLVAECRRQEESCLYTSTTLYIWLREARLIRRIFVVAPVILGALATWSVLDQPEREWLVWLTALFALLTGLFPAVFEALKLDAHVDSIANQAAAFKNLQDRFRQLGTVTALGPYETFDGEFRQTMDRMDEARAASITPPERCFEAARTKIEAGHYDFAADASGDHSKDSEPL